MTRKKVREHLFQMLFAIDFHQKEELEEQVAVYLDSIQDFSEAAREEKEEKLEQIRTELRERFFGVISHIDDIDRKIGEHAKGWDIHRLGKSDVTVLRLAIYEMLFDDEVPIGVAVDEGVRLAKKFGQEKSPGFVNGILGTIARENESVNDEKAGRETDGESSNSITGQSTY